MAPVVTSPLVVAVASSALFDLTESDHVFRTQGVDDYRTFQCVRERVPLAPGVAFPLVRRLLALRDRTQETPLVEVILLSRNDPDTGVRVLRSIEHHGLPMSRAIFSSGRAPYHYAQAVGASLFLSAHLDDVRAALESGVPAGRVGLGGAVDDVDDSEVRLAFDFDGVLADDGAEAVFQTDGLEAFHSLERTYAEHPLSVGPLAHFCKALGRVQRQLSGAEEGHVPRIRTAIITSRGAPAQLRVMTSLRSWGISVDDAFFLGGLSKGPVVQAWRPHIFFDDQLCHLQGAAASIPCAHVPFGVANRLASTVQASRAH